MTYEKHLRRALEIARGINYEPIYGSRGGERGVSDSTPSYSNLWILDTGFWRDIGYWIDTENWID